MAGVLRSVDAVLDVVRVPVDADPADAVKPLPDVKDARDESCEILIAGGGIGGVAAALAAARCGRRVVLLEETHWLGGQMTSQGVSALDEHELIETFGGTASYYRLRDTLRDHYRERAGEQGQHIDFNPGACWASRLAFEPRAGVAAIERLLEPYLASGCLVVHRRTKVIAATTHGDYIGSLVAIGLDDNRLTRFHPELVIDATELGDLLPLTGAEHVIGAETIAETGESLAEPEGSTTARAVQSFTYTFACERRADNEDHTIPAPADYGVNRVAQPYGLRAPARTADIDIDAPAPVEYALFERMPGTPGGLWTARRLLARDLFEHGVAYDVALFNGPGNHYRGRSLLDASALEAAHALRDAKRLSLGFVHWLQTEAQATATRAGARELRLHRELMGSRDGLSQHPYIRESRRLRAVRTIVEQDVSARHQPGPRAAAFADSVGVGWHPIELQRGAHGKDGGRTRPFQIPLGALLPRRIANLIAGGKNIGTTHVTNGCYRMHSVEWNVGEAAGSLAAFALEEHVSPRAVRERGDLLARFQRLLIAEGVPLAWGIDVSIGNPAFAGSQWMLLSQALGPLPDLRFEPQRPMTAQDWQRAGGTGPVPATRAAAAIALATPFVA